MLAVFRWGNKYRPVNQPLEQGLTVVLPATCAARLALKSLYTANSMASAEGGQPKYEYIQQLQNGQVSFKLAQATSPKDLEDFLVKHKLIKESQAKDLINILSQTHSPESTPPPVQNNKQSSTPFAN